MVLVGDVDAMPPELPNVRETTRIEVVLGRGKVRRLNRHASTIRVGAPNAAAAASVWMRQRRAEHAAQLGDRHRSTASMLAGHVGLGR
jgi:hypothetical protein